ncbi:uncharacterized protein LOC119931127 [Tachyglossus aculeatus]|uniref:uncharacterized protein LOC119931127 n=1 Tax=Tachyglossus aculeatus TaxID=9261 RepID=UPI0018F71AFF|nr:uncharacterized protein LOC119931127 [Tachyglossus aculeatus]
MVDQMMIWVFVARLLFIGALASEIQMKDKPATDFIAVECLGSLSRMTLNATYIRHKFVDFYAIDHFGTVRKIDHDLAIQCGYTISYDHWGNIEFRASLLSCYAYIESDINFTVNVQINIATNPEKTDVAIYQRSVSCSYTPWCSREIICENNYMEVSVRREVPLIPADLLQDEPEDWAVAFPEATSGVASIWQIVFHTLTGRRVMLVSDAHRAGYGINTTDTRILLRAAFNTTEAQQVEIQGITFSAVRSSTFYKQRWMILMVDTAVACPLGDMEYDEDSITWTIPKNISPLLAGARNFKDITVEFGINLHKLLPADLTSRKITMKSDMSAVTIKVPIGAEGGYYKTHVRHGRYGRTYSINLFLEHQWEDDKWGVTKHTIIKAITTPLKLQEPIITNNTNTSTRYFNVSIGPFLPDVKLVHLTIDGKLITMSEANQYGFQVFETMYPNGTKGYVIEAGFDAPGVTVVLTDDDTRTYTLNITLGFIVDPTRDAFVIPVSIESPVRDVVMPQAEGFCDAENLYLTITRGNVDQDWIPFLSNLQLTPKAAQSHKYGFHDNATHLALRVPCFAAHVIYEDIRSSGITVKLQLTMKDNSTLKVMRDYSITCIFPSKDLIDCQSNGSMVVTAMKLAGIPDLDPSELVLRDRRCKPAVVTKTSAKFIFKASTCGTSRKFGNNTLTYENDVLYFKPGRVDPVYRLKCACQYLIDEMVTSHYHPKENPAPIVKAGKGNLALIMRLSKDKSYSELYEDTEYPVVKYLKEALYFETELLYNADPQLELFLEDCWCTIFPNKDSSPQWDVITNSCPNNEDSHQTIFHSVAEDSRVMFPSHLKRFEVKMFTFMKEGNALLQNMYFHCSVIICETKHPSSDFLCARRCIPGKQRSVRSIDSFLMQSHISSGMIILTTSKNL